MMRRFWLAMILAFGLVAASGAQSAPQNPPATASQAASEQTAAQSAAKQQGPSAQLAEASREAAGEDENAQFKHSAVVRWVSSKLGISTAAEYWVLYSIDFLIIALLIAWAWKSNLPAMFRSRTESIRKGMDEARRSSEDATRRLSEVESRLARLDAEIAAMRASADQEAVAEEERIRVAAEADRHKIVEAAENEIQAAGKQARRELKAFAAELAVSLAEKRIQVDANTDRALVHTFVAELGQEKNGGGR